MLLMMVLHCVVYVRCLCGLGLTYTTICFRDRSLLVMNFRVRMVTGWSALAGVAMIANMLQTEGGQAVDLLKRARRRNDLSMVVGDGHFPAHTANLGDGPALDPIWNSLSPW